MDGFTVSIPPTSDPVTLTDVKRHLRIHPTDTDQDDTIRDLIKTATELFQEDTGGRQLVEAGLTSRLAGFPAGVGLIELLPTPLISVETFEYWNSASPSVKVPVSSDVWEIVIDREPGHVRLKFDQVWPTDARGHADDLEIVYTAGYADRESIPYGCRAAIMLMLSHFFHNRGAFGTARDERLEVPGYRALVRRFQVVTIR